MWGFISGCISFGDACLSLLFQLWLAGIMTLILKELRYITGKMRRHLGD